MPRTRPARRQGLGRMGEEIACRGLASRGLEIIERNYRCSAGEMDVVARAPGRWIFVEVKTRRGNRYGTAAEAVNARKQRKLIEVAETYMQEHALVDVDWRIDVVAVDMDEQGRLLRTDVIENAVSR